MFRYQVSSNSLLPNVTQDKAQGHSHACDHTYTHTLRILKNASVSQHLIRANMDELAAIITREQGKTLGDAKGDVFRGLEVVEFACGSASHTMGETVENVGGGLDTYSYRQVWNLPCRARCKLQALTALAAMCHCSPSVFVLALRPSTSQP